MTSFMMTTKWATDQSAIKTCPCMNIVIFMHNLGNWLILLLSHMCVQWHLGFFSEDYTPTRRGFDSHYGYFSGMEDYLDHSYAAAWPDDVSIDQLLYVCTHVPHPLN